MKRTELKKKGSLKRKTFTSTKSGLQRQKFKNKKTKHKARNKIKAKSTTSPLWKLIHDTDRVFSLLVRAMGADRNGIVKCYTCDYKGFWKYDKIQCGHFISRANLGTRFDIKSNKPQCSHCNSTLNGNLKVFEENLLKEYGKDFMAKLEELRQNVVRMKVERIREIKLELNRQLKEIKLRKGL